MVLLLLFVREGFVGGAGAAADEAVFSTILSDVRGGAAAVDDPQPMATRERDDAVPRRVRGTAVWAILLCFCGCFRF